MSKGKIEKIKRDAFLYLKPRPPEAVFAQCITCVNFINDKGLCQKFSDKNKIDGTYSCGFYAPGPNATGKEPLNLVTPQEAGLVKRKVRCENCAFFDPDTEALMHCDFFTQLNRVFPHLFDLDRYVDPHGCCNAQTEGQRDPNVFRPFGPIKHDSEVRMDSVDVPADQNQKIEAAQVIIAAGIMLCTSDGRVLLLKRSSAGGDHGGEWAFPGGKIEDGETPEQAARRETAEETGLQYDGPLREWTRRIKDGADFTTFIAIVPAFDPVLNEEHISWAWVPNELAMTWGSPPLHPGVSVALNKFEMNDLGLAQAIISGELTSPQRFASFLLISIRITGTGLSYRTDENEFVIRDPAHYCNPEFVARCNGLPVIWKHQTDEELLDTKDFVERIIGTVFLPYIKDGTEEVWAIAKIYDENCAKYLIENKASTSPFVAFSKKDLGITIPQKDGKHILIEGPPTIIDSIAVLPGPGVWDKGGPLEGVESVSADSAEQNKLDVALGVIRAARIDDICLKIGK